MVFLRHSFFAAFFILIFISCNNTETVQPLDLENIDWKIYRNRNIGFELKFPAIFTYEVKDNGHNVFLKYADENTLLIRYATEEEGYQRGLWFGNDVEESIIINDHKWLKYIYKHYDGPNLSTTTTYVTPLNDRYLGVEFRTNVGNKEFQDFVMNSFMFLKPEAPRHIQFQ